ncbi:MAG: energy transducer TonB [Flavobacteriales bacterium]
MKAKKTKKANIERWSWVFFLFGFIFATSSSIGIINMEWAQASLVDKAELNIDLADEMQPIELASVQRARPLPEPKLAVTIPKPKPEPKVSPEPKVEPKKEPLKTKLYDIKPIEDGGDDEFEPAPTFMTVEKIPRFEDCKGLSDKSEQLACFEAQVVNHIRTNFKYPTIEKELGIEGKIFVQFTIDKKGQISDLEFHKNNQKGFIKESARLIKSLPIVEPAYQRNKPVAIKYTVPIFFKLKK